MIRGRVLHVEGQELWYTNGRDLVKSPDSGETVQLRVRLPIRGLREALSLSRLGRRLGRVGCHHFLKTGVDCGIVFGHRGVFELRPGSHSLRQVAPIHGSRPLAVCWNGQRAYYGEYRGNEERSPVRIWACGVNPGQWESVWCFQHVRHVHGVFFDPFSSALWVTTGDTDGESAIWVTKDDFQTLDFIVGGEQRYRAVQLLFSEGHVYFGSDAPEQVNHIYRLDRQSGEVEQIIPVGGPVYFGTQVGDWLFFSTTAEPSRVNNEREAELWGSPDGENWQLLRKYRKDRWPMRFFQYGQIHFPLGPGDGSRLWYTPFGTESDQHTFALALSSL